MLTTSALAFLAATAAHADEPGAPQPEVRPPARCLMAWCTDDYSFGLAFRPSIELGYGLGSGYGFDDLNNDAGHLIAGAGARFFFFRDIFDIRASVGGGLSWYNNGTHDADTGTVRPGVFYVFGLGFFHGLFGVSFVLVDDPEHSVPLGKGVNTTFDVAALANLFGR